MFYARVDSVGVIFDNDNDFGQIHCMSSNDTVTETETKYDLKHLNDNQRLQMLTLLQKHEKIFNDKPGRSKIGIHEIKLKPNYTAKRKAPYRIP